MAGPRSIDRDRLLDAAEEIVRVKGATALTIDALARACGITKGGVHYAMGTKDDIIDALFARWNRDYDARFAAMAGLDVTTPEGRRARLAFLACEGAFLLHFLRFMPLEDAEWQAVFDDIGRLLTA